MMQDLASQLASPDAFLFGFEDEQALFVPMDAAAYRRSIFLDSRIKPATPETTAVPAQRLAALDLPRLPVSWIFHFAHCGSTLLARALDQLDQGLVLREPLALRQLALEPGRAGLTAAVLALLSRRYSPLHRTIIKANVPVNFMLERIIPHHPGAAIKDRAVLLYSGFETYLCAVLRTPQHRSWVRTITELLGPALGVPLPDQDGPRAALLWLAQVHRFANLLTRTPSAAALDFDRFMADPALALHQVSTFLGLAALPQTARQIATGPLFAAYAKNPDLPFDNRARLAAREQARRGLHAELRQAEAWLKEAGASRPEISPHANLELLINRDLLRS